MNYRVFIPLKVLGFYQQSHDHNRETIIQLRKEAENQGATWMHFCHEYGDGVFDTDCEKFAQELYDKYNAILAGMNMPDLSCEITPYENY